MGRTSAELRAAAAKSQGKITKDRNLPEASSLIVRAYMDSQMDSLRQGHDYSQRATKRICGVPPISSQG